MMSPNFQCLIFHQSLILEKEAEPKYQEAVIQLIAHFLAALFGKDGLVLANQSIIVLQA